MHVGARHGHEGIRHGCQGTRHGHKGKRRGYEGAKGERALDMSRALRAQRATW